MKLSVCVDALYNNKNFINSLEKVKEEGYETIEFWSWWDKDIIALKAAKDKLEINISAFCTKMISLTDETQRDAYYEGLKESIEVAKKLGCKKLITQVGNELSGVTRQEQKLSIINGLKKCVSILEKSEIILLIEPLNTLVDHKGYYLSASKEAFDIIDKVNSPNVKVLFDIYHQQIMEGNLISNIMASIDKIGHFHSAGNPGRHELTSGEINYKGIFEAIDTTSYDGYCGLEYFPINDVTDGLKELKKQFINTDPFGYVGKA